MRKLWFTLALCAALLMTVPALAGKPVGGLRRRALETGGLQARSPYSVRTDRDTYEAGEPVTILAAIPEGGCYEICLGVLDGSDPDPNIADILWMPGEMTAPSCEYNLIWTPGEYVFFYDIYSRDAETGDLLPAVSDYCMFTVTETTGTNLLKQKARQAVAACRGKCDFETVINLHDWVLAHCTYDDSETYYSAESLFFLERGVCNSYSRAFDLLLRTAGIDSARVLGWAYEISNESGHAWNAALVDGEWYLYDCTWDDVSSSYYSHRYCGLPSDLMNLDNEHIVEYIPGGACSCTSMDSNYFVRTGKWRQHCGAAADEMRAQLAAGLHTVSVQTGYDYGPGMEAELYVNNRIVAAGIGATVWNDAAGQMCVGTFSVTRGSNEITGSVHAWRWSTLPESTQIIECFAFEDCKFENLWLPDACTAIEAFAFKDVCLQEIWIGANVTHIDDLAFIGCPDFIIRAPVGSYAAEWAELHSFTYTWMQGFE
ncbi:MAG: leucine-rich repeat protein [Clostridia bacterium]|nr:leucine-rich repeat protein [Clostridia bacterium]